MLWIILAVLTHDGLSPEALARLTEADVGRTFETCVATCIDRYDDSQMRCSDPEETEWYAEPDDLYERCMSDALWRYVGCVAECWTSAQPREEAARQPSHKLNAGS